MNVKAIPEGYHSLTAYLSVEHAAQAIEFYTRAFDAVEAFRLDMPDGRVGHAELSIGNSRLMLSESCSQGPLGAPDPASKPAFGMHLYVDDVDTCFRQAIDAGAQEVSAVSDQFYGDRSGTLKDPYGHFWFIATHKEDLTHEQIHERARQMLDSSQA